MRFSRILILISIILLSSCHKKEKEAGTVLLRYGDREITLDEVVAQIPEGLAAADSTALFKAILDGWLSDVVLSDFAEERLLDISGIERRVRDYRNSLIVQEYLTKMREAKTPTIDEQKVKEYYDHHRNELKLEVPLVRGVFLKISSDARGKEGIKSLLSSDNPEMIDKLEQEWLDRALEYNYFHDKWIDWETLAGMIPYRFGDPERFLSEHKYFETEYGDCSYYLQISDYLPAGEQQPYEFASAWISALLTQGELADYQKSLVESIISGSIKDKKLEMIGYDPLRHEIIENHVKNNDEKK